MVQTQGAGKTYRFKTGPVTGRTANILTNYYGYDSVDEFAADIPEGSDIVDIGSGFSSLGHEVVTRRPDVHWVNFDVIYGDIDLASHLKALRRYSPTNLTHISGNILDPPRELKPGTFDLIFSYYMLPHIMNQSGRSKAITAAQNMLKLGAPGAVLSIGPAIKRTSNARSLILPEAQSSLERCAVGLVDDFDKGISHPLDKFVRLNKHI